MSAFADQCIIYTFTPVVKANSGSFLQLHTLFQKIGSKNFSDHNILWCYPLHEKRRPFGRPFYALAAAAVIVAATVVTAVVTAPQTIIATAAEQNQQDDDPPAAVAAHTVIAHNPYLQKFLSRFIAAHSKIFRRFVFVR